MNIPAGIIPAIRSMKDFETAIESDHSAVILLETRLAQLKSLVTYAKRANKQVFVHVDLIQGLKADEYGMEFLVRAVKPDGVISTRGNIIKLAKKHKLTAIQRMFLLDSMAVDHNLQLIDRFQPDCVELLPGLVPDIITQIYEEASIPVIAGGLIRNEQEVSSALEAGAVAVSTSNAELWKK
ncbi:glycerol-3-phosphate responsive antiterminator [Lentibacillus cibarius]|uniref:Glycerol uptake operon antiterminator regulatory protein n=1 Tax=Lentibacillus cibarius TaxID=2583219 RepID=A0A549YMK9_9BACI|nr:glycerol-3-phosphate responsive antiterminator [Lentibacillus cibarius]TRM13119.1 glycerol-3-phosphate responsive antiterminator [Lentibacillus cibarius]